MTKFLVMILKFVIGIGIIAISYLIYHVINSKRWENLLTKVQETSGTVNLRKQSFKKSYTMMGMIMLLLFVSINDPVSVVTVMDVTDSMEPVEVYSPDVTEEIEYDKIIVHINSVDIDRYNIISSNIGESLTDVYTMDAQIESVVELTPGNHSFNIESVNLTHEAYAAPYFKALNSLDTTGMEVGKTYLVLGNYTNETGFSEDGMFESLLFIELEGYNPELELNEQSQEIIDLIESYYE